MHVFCTGFWEKYSKYYLNYQQSNRCSWLKTKKWGGERDFFQVCICLSPGGAFTWEEAFEPRNALMSKGRGRILPRRVMIHTFLKKGLKQPEVTPAMLLFTEHQTKPGRNRAAGKHRAQREVCFPAHFTHCLSSLALLLQGTRPWNSALCQ